MRMQDVVALNMRLQRLYAERFPLLTPEMLSVWEDALASADPEDMEQAVRRWVRQHYVGQPPTLQGLLDTLELVEEDKRAIQAALRPLRPQTPSSVPAAVLMQAAASAPHALQSFAQCHVQMVLEGLGRPNNYPLTAARCLEFAAQFPEDSISWEREALWWEHGAHGPSVLERMPGEEG